MQNSGKFKQNAIFIVLLAALMSSCRPTPHNKLTIIHLVDVSESATKDENFVKLSENICDLLTGSLVVDDLYLRINVDSALPPFKDPVKIQNQDQINFQRKNCLNKKVNSSKPGTSVCPAWKRTSNILSRKRLTDNKPLIISQIQSNELEFNSKNTENNCIVTIKKLTEKVNKAEGVFIHLDSTNLGSKLNRWLEKHLIGYDNVDYYDESHLGSIQSDINKLRFKDIDK